MTVEFHPELRQLRQKLQEIYAASAHFHPLSLKPPILDSSIEASNESSDDSPWTHQEQIPGLRQLRECIRLDLDVLDKVGGVYSIELNAHNKGLRSSSSFLMTQLLLPCHLSPPMRRT